MPMPTLSFKLRLSWKHALVTLESSQVQHQLLQPYAQIIKYHVVSSRFNVVPKDMNDPRFRDHTSLLHLNSCGQLNLS